MHRLTDTSIDASDPAKHLLAAPSTFGEKSTSCVMDDTSPGRVKKSSCLVPYILLSEFDIETGSTLKAIYPTRFETDDALADLMLPDGAHLRSEDWTTFYLTMPTGLSPAASPLDRMPRPNLLYVLNLVRTMKDDTAKRGARVKALAICSVHPWIQIYKPVLLLALEEYFLRPTTATLAKLHSAINDMDVERVPHFSHNELLVLKYSDRPDLFEERFESSLPSSSRTTSQSALNDEDWHSTHSTTTEAAALPNDTAGDVLGRDRIRLRSDTGHPAPNGAPDLLGGRYPLREPKRFEGDTFLTAPNGASRPRDTHFYDTKMIYDGVYLPIRIPLATFAEDVGDYSLISLVQTFSSSAAVASSATLHPHLHTAGAATPPIIVLLNALLTGMRVVFLGNGQAANVVANHVLASCAMASGGGSILRGFADRAFPYSHLAMLDQHEKTPGAIVGVTNPIFEELTSRWDVLCNVETGKVTVSKDLKASPSGHHSRPFSPVGSDGSRILSASAESTSFPLGDVADTGRPASAQRESSKSDSKPETYDVSFAEEVHASILAHEGEGVIRARFADYVARFVRLVALYEVETYGSTTIAFPCVTSTSTQLGSGPFSDQKELGLNAARFEAWRSTESYSLYRQDFEAARQTKAIKGIDVAHQIGRLRSARRLLPGEAALILTELSRAVRTDEQIIELLTHLPMHMDGLLPITFGLFHPNPTARSATSDLLELLNSHPVGSKFVQSLNTFHRLAFARLVQDDRAHRPEEPHAARLRVFERTKMEVPTPTQGTAPQAVQADRTHDRTHEEPAPC